MPTAAFAAAMVPGMWMLSMTVVGTGARNAPQVVSQCISQSDIDDATRALPRPAGACTLSNIKRTDDTATYDLACLNGSVQAQGRADIRFEGDHYGGAVVMSITEHGAPAQMTALRVDARRTGDCTK
jgi:hypothetical protein